VDTVDTVDTVLDSHKEGQKEAATRLKGQNKLSSQSRDIYSSQETVQC
jgi:hypothetical protein